MNYFEGYEEFIYDKNKEPLKIYPILLKDRYIYNIMNTLLAYPKHISKRKEILKSSYLKFMLNYMLVGDKKEEITYEDKNRVRSLLSILLAYCFKIDIRKIYIDINSKSGVCTIELYNGAIIINETQFNKIRSIILDMNGISLRSINEYNEKLEEDLKVWRKINKIAQDLTDEDLFFSLCIAMHKSPTELKNELTFYEFKQLTSRIARFVNYNIYKPLEASGQIKYKNNGKTEDWIYHIQEKGRYDEILISASQYEANTLSKFAK